MKIKENINLHEEFVKKIENKPRNIIGSKQYPRTEHV